MCVVPNNQRIYQALQDKADSYPVDKPFHAQAYSKAAYNVSKWEFDLYDFHRKYGHVQELAGFGPSVTSFLNDFIKNGNKVVEPTQPVQPVEQEQPVQNSGSDTPSTDNIRRSKRIANKPKKTYYSSEDEAADIEEVILDYCNKRGLKYSEELVNEYYEYVKIAPSIFHLQLDYKFGFLRYATLREKVSRWAKHESKSLQEQRNDIKIDNNINKYCMKKYIEYNPNMLREYKEWATNNKVINKGINNFLSMKNQIVLPS